MQSISTNEKKNLIHTNTDHATHNGTQTQGRNEQPTGDFNTKGKNSHRELKHEGQNEQP